MSSKILKTGTFSVVLSSHYFDKHVSPIEDKLLKIVKITDNHNETKNLSIIRKIPNYKDYYSIIGEVNFILFPTDIFYKVVQNLVADQEMTIFNSCLNCYYIDNAGDLEMHDSLDYLIHGDYSFWKSYKIILKFVHKILLAVSFLHKHNMCHLDIKPENIMIDTSKYNFKLIDFGFSSVEPFKDFCNYPKGTPGYFPKQMSKEAPTGYLPKIRAIDLELINGEIPMRRNFRLVYKIDSFCLGRVLYFLKYVYDEEKVYGCWNTERRLGRKIDSIAADLLCNDVYMRITATQCLEKYFE